MGVAENFLSLVRRHKTLIAACPCEVMDSPYRDDQRDLYSEDEARLDSSRKRLGIARYAPVIVLYKDVRKFSSKLQPVSQILDLLSERSIGQSKTSNELWQKPRFTLHMLPLLYSGCNHYSNVTSQRCLFSRWKLLLYARKPLLTASSSRHCSASKLVLFFISHPFIPSSFWLPSIFLLRIASSDIRRQPRK